MTTTADLDHEPGTGVPELRDRDRAAALDAVVSARRNADREEARLLAAAVHWVDLHPVTDEHPAATFPTQPAGGLAAALGPGFFARALSRGTARPVSRSTRSRSWPRR